MSNYKASRTEESDKILSIFAQNLKKCRIAKGISQEQLALTAGISRSYYTEIETGKRNISLLNLVKLMTVLEVDANFLSDFEEK